jgi:phosphosulfolactate phosphohydrolase-like enzyme
MTTGERSPVRSRAELGEQGARRGARRGDVVVIIDALRASATIVAALEAGAQRVIAVRRVKEAMAYLGDPRYRVAGERGAAKLSTFHYGNSPTEIWTHRAEIAGRTLVLTTSNGTRCIYAAVHGAADVLVGSTVNARAVARAAFALAEAQGTGVSLVAAGIGGLPAAEDTFSQGLIGGHLTKLGVVPAGWTPSAEAEHSAAVFLGASAARALAKLGYAQDTRLCAQVDLWESVPRYRNGGFFAQNTSRGDERQPEEALSVDHG